jgi:hypothetical protein
VSGVGRIGAVIALRAAGFDAPRAQSEVNEPSDQQNASHGGYDMICCHLPNMVADSGRCKSAVSATRRPNLEAFSAYIPFYDNFAIVGSPNQEDLKWLTTISQNRHPIVRTGFPSAQAKDLAWVVWGSLSRASSSCLLCFKLSLAALRCRLSKTQARSRHLLLNPRRCRANNAAKSITLRSLFAGSPTGAGLLALQRTKIKHLSGGRPC